MTGSGKTPIVVYAWHVFESSGGFLWDVATPESIAALAVEFERDRLVNGITSATLLTLSVAGYGTDLNSRLSITEYFEGQLQDAFEVGWVGHILARHNSEADA